MRSVAGKKRNIYLVSKAVKEVMGMIDDSHKVCCIHRITLISSMKVWVPVIAGP